MGNRRISVCMTSYNGSMYIEEQVDSILSQLSSEDELIISDDGSADNTIALIRGYMDKRIKVYTNNFKNHILNFEFVLSKATGDYIFLSDQDDIWLPNKVSVMLSYLSTYDLVCSDCFVVDSNCDIIKDSFCDKDTKECKGFIKNLIHNHYLGCCMAFNNKILSKSLPFPKGLITHDTFIGLISEVSGNSVFINDKLIYFRRHDTNTSNTLKGSTLSFKQKIQYRYVICKGIINNLFIRKN